MAVITSTNLSNALKVLYNGQKLKKVIYGSEARTAFNMLQKMKSFMGSHWPLPVYYGDAVGGRTVTLATGQTNASAPSIAQFQLDVVENNGVLQIATDAIMRSRGDKGAFLRGQELRVDAILNALANDIEIGLFGLQDGRLGSMSNTGFATAVMTFNESGVAKKFAPGQVLVLAANAASNPRAGTLTVLSVQKASNTVTMTGNISAGVAAAATNDLVFVQGDYVAANDVNKIAGFPEWLPSSTLLASKATLFAQDRSVDPEGLAGIRHAGALADVKKAIVDCAQKIADYGDGMPDTAFCSFTTWGHLADQLQTDVLRHDSKDVTAGYQYVSVYGPRGTIKVIPCTFCEENVIFLLTLNTWKLISMGEPVRVVDDDGLVAQRLATTSGLEVRVDSHANLACLCPLHNGRIDLS
jgi:hypothetical protein